jgi:hypothetical protein
MASLTNTKIKDTYPGLLKTTDNAALGGTYKLITDGLGNSSGVYLGTGGNVGIGENVPSKPLTINKNQSETVILVQSSDTGVSGIYLGGQSDSIKGGLVCNNSDNSIKLQGYNNATRLFVKSDGNIGIGDTDPGAKLVVAQPQITSGGFSTPFIELKSTAQTNNTGLVAMSFSTSTADNYGYSIGALRGSSGGASSFVISHHDNSLTGTERIRIDSSGNVGIGTTSVDDKLHILGDSVKIQQFGQAGIAFKFNHGNNSSSGSDVNYSNIKSLVTSGNTNFESGVLTFETRNSGTTSERMRIDSSGRVGIGTSSPSHRLDLTTSDTTWAAAIKNTNSTNGFGLFLQSAESASKAILGAFSGSSYKFYVRGDGNVGIGTSSPTADLSVGSTSTSSGDVHLRTTKTTFSMTPSNTDAGGMFLDVGWASGGQGPFKFGIGGSEKMRLDSSGNVLIGTTNAGISASSTSSGICLINDGRVTSSAISNAASIFNRNTTNGDLILMRRGGSNVGSISVTTSATSYNTSSDYRLKENVVDMTGALDRVDQLEPKRFNFISDTETTVDGFIAHEVQGVIPEAVTGEKDAVDDEGNPEYQGIDQSKIVPLLVGAIKELKSEIETLKSQINS